MKIKKKSFLLDTSIFIEKCKYPSIEKFLEQKRTSGYELVSSFFVLYEFKVGFIRNLIDFYSMVGAYGEIDKALIEWSEKYGRGSKYALIYMGMISRMKKSVDINNVEDCLAQFESIIFNEVNTFRTFLDSMVGEFENDEIVKFKLRSKDDFLSFMDLYNKRSSIPLNKFWDKNIISLDKMISCPDLSKKYEGMHKNLKKVKKDTLNANKIMCNRSIGDAVIATDCSLKRVILSKDNSFSILCEVLNKKCEIIKRTDYSS